jgi:hypothetical protein
MDLRLIALACLAAALTGCVMLDRAEIPTGPLQGARLVTTRPLFLHGARGDYPDLRITSHYLTAVNHGNRFTVRIGTVPAGTTVEVVGAVARTALGRPHSRVYTVRLAGPDLPPLPAEPVDLAHDLLAPAPDGWPRPREEFFRATPNVDPVRP